MDNSLFYQKINHLFDSIRVLKNNRTAIRLPYKKVENGEVYIMGNGPSLKQSLEYLLHAGEKKKFFAVNDFAVSELFEQVKPCYYILIDNGYWVEESKATERDLKLRQIVFNNIIEKTQWSMGVFIPDYAYKKKYFHSLLQNTKISLIPYNRYSIKMEHSDYYFRHLEKNDTAYFNNVLANAIYCAINRGFDEINVLGAEHSWTKDIRVNDQNQVCTIKKHFFEDDSELIPWEKSDGTLFSMAELLSALTLHFQAYDLLEEYAKRKNVHIYNLTSGSFIDAFERKKL